MEEGLDFYPQPRSQVELAKAGGELNMGKSPFSCC